MKSSVALGINMAVPALLLEITVSKVLHTFAGRLKHLMNVRGLSQVDLARATGISQPTISEWINGKTLPRAAQWDRLCEYMDIEPGELLTGPTEPLDSYAIANLLEVLAKTLGYDMVKRPKSKPKK